MYMGWLQYGNNKIQIIYMKLGKSNSKFIQENLLSSLAFSHSGQFCCMATKHNVKLLVYKVKDLTNIDSWELIQEMHEQTQPVSEIDWARDDKIIAGSHDRSAFIYKRSGNAAWQKMLVNIDVKLSILCVKWAPSSKKFALGASCRTLGLGFYNIESCCWTMAVKEKFSKAPITSISFHPSSNILAVGSSDNSVKVVSCSFKSSKDPFVQKSDIEDKSYQGSFQNVDTLFETLLSIEDVGGWVNHLSFELNGSFLLVLPHSNHFKIYDIADQGNKLQSKEIDIKWNGLPFLNGYVSDKGVLYTGGFDKKIAVFNRSSGGFNFVQYLQNNEKSSQKKEKRGIVSSMLTGIEKRSSMFGQGPDPSEHLNAIKVMPSINRKYVISYDVNGIVHFWQ